LSILFIPSTTVRFDPEDIALAQEQAGKRLEYQTYLKMSLHEALINAKS